MREVPLSNCEKDFIRKAIAEKRRIDGRQAFDYRKIKITFGVDRGCCQVEMGQTRVLAQTSCQVVEPKAARPSDGQLFINVELSPMACPSFEPGRLSDYGVEMNRLLERCLKESRCVDTESLCIVAGEKVWEVRVDVHALNHDGNLIDCASIAAITALTHFRRPDVTVSGDEVTIHPPEEKDPVPLSVHHMPICVTFAFYELGKYLLVDPTDIEEKVMDGKMVIGMNKHREICTLQIAGQMLLLKEQILRCSNIAVVKVAEITELIHKALENDRQIRAKGGKFGFTESILTEKVTANQMTGHEVNMEEVKDEVASVLEADKDSDWENESSMNNESEVKILDKGIGCIGEGGPSTWEVADEDMTELQEEQKLAAHKPTAEDRISPHVGTVEGDSSEEETTHVLSGGDLDLPAKATKTQQSASGKNQNPERTEPKKNKKKKAKKRKS